MAPPTLQCTYKEVGPEQNEAVKSEEVEMNVEERESHQSNSESLTYFSHAKAGKIEIHSTVGWTYPSQRTPRV